ncbi:MAG: sulfite exporter TauE/SafE family protein [Planctomycetota bacterium]|nr:sulfite exporter TauE/SafE family protein [Planctomycetota bacterium]
MTDSKSEELLEQEVDLGRRGKFLLLVGVLIGFVSSMCGIGGGLFAVPLLHFGFHVHLRRAVATGLCLVFATTLASTLTEISSGLFGDGSMINWPLVGCLAVGALGGTQLGYPVSKRFDTRQLRGVFSIVIAVVAIRILTSGESVGHIASEASLGNYMYAIGAGFLGGFVSPILGIGGGLVMVPALLLGPSALGFAGARACALAAAVVTSGRSLSLYWKERTLHTKAAPLLGGGAFLGAIAGVNAVHLDGVVDIARGMLGFILLFVSVRFAVAWWRTRPSRSRDEL